MWALSSIVGSREGGEREREGGKMDYLPQRACPTPHVPSHSIHSPALPPMRGTNPNLEQVKKNKQVSSIHLFPSPISQATDHSPSQPRWGSREGRQAGKAKVHASLSWHEVAGGRWGRA